MAVIKAEQRDVESLPEPRGWRPDMVSESDFLDMLAKAEAAGDVRLAREIKRILGEFREASQKAASISLDLEAEAVMQEVCAATGLSRSAAVNLAIKQAFNVPAMVAAAPELSRQLAINQGIKKGIKRHQVKGPKLMSVERFEGPAQDLRRERGEEMRVSSAAPA